MLLNRLLRLFTRTGAIGLSSHVLKLLLNLIDVTIENGHKEYLREFIRFHCTVSADVDSNVRLSYEGILESIGLLVGFMACDVSRWTYFFRLSTKSSNLQS